MKPVQKRRCEGVASADGINYFYWVARKSAQSTVNEDSASCATQSDADSLYTIGGGPMAAELFQAERLIAEDMMKQQLRLRIVQFENGGDPREILNKGEIPMARAQVHIVEPLCIGGTADDFSECIEAAAVGLG